MHGEALISHFVGWAFLNNMNFKSAKCKGTNTKGVEQAYDYGREATEYKLLVDCYSYGCKHSLELCKINIKLKFHQSVSGYP